MFILFYKLFFKVSCIESNFGVKITSDENLFTNFFNNMHQISYRQSDFAMRTTDVSNSFSFSISFTLFLSSSSLINFTEICSWYYFLIVHCFTPSSYSLVLIWVEPLCTIICAHIYFIFYSFNDCLRHVFSSACRYFRLSEFIIICK